MTSMGSLVCDGTVILLSSGLRNFLVSFLRFSEIVPGSGNVRLRKGHGRGDIIQTREDARLVPTLAKESLTPHYDL
jgi:hypothetical protein